MKKKVFLTGASGFLGWNILNLAKNKHNFIGQYHSSKVYSDIETIRVNLSSESEIHAALKKSKPDLVIHTASISNANFCQENNKYSHAINVKSSLCLAEYCSDKSIPYSFVSSDLVFDGKKGDYSEKDKVNPISLYGEQKVKAEEGINKIYLDANIFRIPLLFGESHPEFNNALYNMIGQIKKSNNVNLFTDEYRTPARAKSVAEGILECCSLSKGVLHLGGIERCSRFHFGELLCEKFDLDKSNINACLQADIKMSAPRPADVSLNSKKAFLLGYKPKTIKQELAEIYEFMN